MKVTTRHSNCMIEQWHRMLNHEEKTLCGNISLHHVECWNKKLTTIFTYIPCGNLAICRQGRWYFLPHFCLSQLMRRPWRPQRAHKEPLPSDSKCTLLLESIGLISIFHSTKSSDGCGSTACNEIKKMFNTSKHKIIDNRQCVYITLFSK